MNAVSDLLTAGAYAALMYLVLIPTRAERVAAVAAALPARFTETWRASAEAETVPPKSHFLDIYDLVQSFSRKPGRFVDKLADMDVRVHAHVQALYVGDVLVLPESCARYVLHRAILTAYCDAAKASQRFPTNSPTLASVKVILERAGCAVGGTWGIPVEQLKSRLNDSLASNLKGAYSALDALSPCDMALLKALLLADFCTLQPTPEEQQHCFREGGAFFSSLQLLPTTMFSNVMIEGSCRTSVASASAGAASSAGAAAVDYGFGVRLSRARPIAGGVTAEYSCIMAAASRLSVSTMIGPATLSDTIAAAANSAAHGREVPRIDCNGRVAVCASTSDEDMTVNGAFVLIVSCSSECRGGAAHADALVRWSREAPLSPGVVMAAAKATPAPNLHATLAILAHTHALVDVENARRIAHGDRPSKPYPATTDGFGTMTFEAVHAMGYARLRRGPRLLDDFDKNRLMDDSSAHSGYVQHQERGCTCSEQGMGAAMVECCSCQRWCHVACYADFAELPELQQEQVVFYCQLCELDGREAAPDAHAATGGPSDAAAPDEAPAPSAPQEAPATALEEAPNAALNALAAAAASSASAGPAWLTASGLRALTGLQQIYATPQTAITPESLRSILQSVAARARHGVLVSQTLSAVLPAYVAAGWARERTPVAEENNIKCIFFMTPQQVNFIKMYPHASDATTLDGSFTSTVFDLYALMGHVPEAGGMATPLFFLVTTGSTNGTPGVQTSLIRWGFSQFAEIAGIVLPQVLLADKELAEQKAWALAAHEALETTDARNERAELYKLLESGGRSAAHQDVVAARRLLAVLDNNSTSTTSMAWRADAAASNADAAAVRESEGAAAGPRVIDALLVGEGAPGGPRAFDAPLASPPAASSADASAALLATWPLLADVCVGLDADKAPSPVSDAVAALFHADVAAQYKSLFPALCVVLREDMELAETARVRARNESASAFMDAHNGLHVWAGLLALDRPLEPPLFLPSVRALAGNFLRRYTTPTFALCWIHAMRAMDRAGKGVPKALKDRLITDFFNTVVRVARDRDDALRLFVAYEARWCGAFNADAWFLYLKDNWLDAASCSLLLLSKRDRTPRLFMITTNTVELLWRVVKTSWLRGRNVQDFAFFLGKVLGYPGDVNKTRESFLSVRIATVDARVKGVMSIRPWAATSRTCTSVMALSSAVGMGILSVDERKDAPGVFRFTSSGKLDRRVLPFPEGECSAWASRESAPAADFYPPGRAEAIAAAVAHVRAVARTSWPST